MSYRFMGASDDILQMLTEDDGQVEFVNPDGSRDSGELGCYDTEVSLLVGDPTKGGIVVVAAYCPGRVSQGWRMSVEPVAEDVGCPWPVEVNTRGSRGYSFVIEVKCPKGTPVKVIDRAGVRCGR